MTHERQEEETRRLERAVREAEERVAQLTWTVDELQAELRQQALRFEGLDTERVAELSRTEERERALTEQLRAAQAGTSAAEDDVARHLEELRRIRTSRSWRIAELLSGMKNSKGRPARIRRALDRFRVGFDDTATMAPVAAAAALPAPIDASAGDASTAVSVLLRLRHWDRAFLETIASLEEQTISALELILCDEWLRPKDVASLVERAAGIDRVKLIRAGDDRLVDDARRLAGGRYLCELESPVHLHPTFLEKAVALLDGDPGVTMVGAWVRTFEGELWRPRDLAAEYMPGEPAPAGVVIRRGVRSTRLLRRTIAEPLIRELTPRRPQREDEVLPAERLRRRPFPCNGRRPVVLTLPWFTLGGGDRVVEALLRHWQHQGRPVVAITTVDLGAGMADRFGELLELTPLAYHLPRLLPTDAWGGFVEDMVGSLDDPALLNIGSPWIYAALPELRARFPRLRVVDQQFNDIGHLPANRSARDAIDVTIAAYTQLAETIRSDGRAPTSVEVVPVGIPTIRPADECEAKAFRQNLEIPDHHRVISFVGRLSPEKRPEWALALAADLAGEDDSSMLLVGDGPLADVLRSGIEAVPTLVWRRSVENIESLLAISDVLIIPSRIEGIPLVAMEALTLGVPVVATRVGGLPELEDDPLVRLCDPTEYTSFVVAVRETLGSPPGTRLWRPDAFSLQVMLDQYDRLIDNPKG